jgi:hypothetical protein
MSLYVYISEEGNEETHDLSNARRTNLEHY